jgi:CHAT domain-containing protein
LEIREKVLGLEHPDVAQILASLADLYENDGRYNKAESLYRRCLKIRESNLGPEHPKVAHSLNGLANLYMDLGRYAEAELLYKRSLEIREKAFGSDHPGIAVVSTNLARLYEETGKHTEAENLLRKALEISEKIHGPGHPRVSSIYKSLAYLLRCQGNFQPSLLSARTAYDIQSKVFKRNVYALKERDALRFSESLDDIIDHNLSIYKDINRNDSVVIIEFSDMLLQSKGIVTDEISKRNRSLTNENDSLLQALSEKYRYAIFQHSNALIKEPGDDIELYKHVLDSMQKVIDSLESELTMKSASFSERLLKRDIDMATTVENLPQHAALIYFMRYSYIPVNDDEDATDRYVALVLTKKGAISINDLGHADVLDSLIHEYRSHMKVFSMQKRMPTKHDLSQYRELSSSIYRRLLEPFENIINDAELLFVSPDGALNMLSFAGLMNDKNEYLVEKFQIHFVSSARDLLRMSDENTNIQGLLAMGNPDFGASPEARLASQVSMPLDSPKQDNVFVSRSSGSVYENLQSLTAEPLSESGEEINSVSIFWEEMGAGSAMIFHGSQASEDHFKRFAPGMRVIHLATHGYYFEEPKHEPRLYVSLDDPGFVYYINPLLLSGVLFAGCNLHGKGSDSAGLEDGFLSAYEVSAMDLTGTDLVVLSACETGLGKVEEGEGVYGLRRAFQLAGARTVVSALWPVDDQRTAEMMSVFYTESDKSIPERMREMQLAQISKLRRQGLSDHPFNWAGFIAIGDWK